MLLQDTCGSFFCEDFARPLLQAFVQQQMIITSSPRHAVVRRKIIITSMPPDDNDHTDQPLTWTTKRASGKG